MIKDLINPVWTDRPTIAFVGLIPCDEGSIGGTGDQQDLWLGHAVTSRSLVPVDTTAQPSSADVIV